MRIAIGIVHGMGQQTVDFYKDMADKLHEAMAWVNPKIKLVIEGIYWADITDSLENKLWQRTDSNQLRWNKTLNLRSFVVNYLGDAIAYQAIPKDDDPCPHDYIYDDIHERYAEQLQRLASRAGDNAPLCIISHSLGTIISSNYFYDLEHSRMRPRIATLIRNSQSKLVNGQTLTHFYTMGSPIALWTMRFERFGQPVTVPASRLKPLGIGEWINFFDRDDIIAYPLKGLNANYGNAVTDDVEIRCPGLLGWTPASHGGYYNSRPLIRRIVLGLDRMSKLIPGGLPD